MEEKSTRVVELLLSTIRPWQLMAGKVTGIGVIGLLQVVAVIAAAAGTALALGLLDTSSLDLGATIAWALVWFVVGFITFALALAALASLVSRQEDVASVTAPVLVLMMIPYMIGISIAPWDPTNPLVVGLSYIPFAAPMVMPMRIALGNVETWEILPVARALPGRDPGARLGRRPDLLERGAPHRRPGAPARGTPRRVTAGADEAGVVHGELLLSLPATPGCARLGGESASLRSVSGRLSCYGSEGEAFESLRAHPS